MPTNFLERIEKRTAKAAQKQARLDQETARLKAEAKQGRNGMFRGGGLYDLELKALAQELILMQTLREIQVADVEAFHRKIIAFAKREAGKPEPIPLQKSDAEELARHGVGMDAVINLMVGVARIRMNGDLWEPVDENERGARVFVTPVRHDRRMDPAIANIEGAISDIVAWHPLRPGKWAMREGTELVLGNVEYTHGIAPLRPVQLYRDPRAWLNHGGNGLVVLAKDPLERSRVLSELEIISPDLTITERPRQVARLRA